MNQLSNFKEDSEEPNSTSMPFLKDSDTWFVCDPCGIVCAVITYLLIAYGEFVVLVILAPPFPTLWTLLSVAVFTGLSALAVVAHVRAMMTEPVRREEGEKMVWTPRLCVWCLLLSTPAIPPPGCRPARVCE